MPDEKKKNPDIADGTGFVDYLRKAQQAVEEAVEDRDDVKDGEVTKEEILNSKAFLLFSAILQTSENTFIREDVQKLMVSVGESIGEQASQSLVQLLIILISTIAYDAISFYDEQLKAEINNNFEPLIGNINANHADITAQEEALKIFRTRLDAYEKILRKAQITGDVNEEG